MTLFAAQPGTMLLDYSFARGSLIPQLGAAKAQGYVGAVRYLSGIAEKDLDAVERDAFAANGMGLAGVWQTSGRPDVSGSAGGRAHCYAAFTQWAGLGAPAGSVIFWACDTNAVSWGQVRPYAQAWAAAAAEQGGTYRVGAYGPSRVVEAAMDEGLAEFAWQPETWWDSQPRRSDVHLIQMVNSRRATFGGSSVDENQVWQPIPLWFPGGADGGFDVQVFRPASTQGEDDDVTKAWIAPGDSLILVTGGNYVPIRLPWPDAHQGLVDLEAAGIITKHADGNLWRSITAPALAALHNAETVPTATVQVDAKAIVDELIARLTR